MFNQSTKNTQHKQKGEKTNTIFEKDIIDLVEDSHDEEVKPKMKEKIKKSKKSKKRKRKRKSAAKVSKANKRKK